MEGRLRVYIQERESAEMKAGSWEKKYQENLVTLRGALGVDYNESVDTMRVSSTRLLLLANIYHWRQFIPDIFLYLWVNVSRWLSLKPHPGFYPWFGRIK